MGRGLWFVAGAGTGVYAMVRAKRIAEALTPEGLADRLGALTMGARMIAEDVRAASEQREAQLRLELGLGLEQPRELATAQAARADQADQADQAAEAAGTAQAHELAAPGYPAAAARAC